MIALPAGTVVYAGGRAWTGEMPDELCPEHLKPVAAPAKGKGRGTPTEPTESEPA